MKDYIVAHPWKIIEDTFHPQYNQITESLCSLGNGMIGQRGNFEEHYSGESLQGNYIAGIYYPDKTRVGWWKNGYPEYFAKVLNSANWIGLDIYFADTRLDLNTAKIIAFQRELDMQEGILHRTTHININGIELKIKTQRFCSYHEKDTAWLKYTIESLNYSGQMSVHAFLDFDVRNQDSNYDENFWENHCQHIDTDWGHVFCKTKKTTFKVCAGFKSALKINDTIPVLPKTKSSEKNVGHEYTCGIKAGQHVTITKHAAIVSEFHHGQVKLTDTCKSRLDKSSELGFDKAKEQHIAAWAVKWKESDIKIQGDIKAQQGIRFNIYHLNQTYTGEDSRLNIGPKGFTGEKYGGSTYWDTEAYCLPFYLCTADQAVAKNLLVYRYNHLQKAIENATKLGFDKGAALFPMVTINGEECHNEWEITFEEIHRNGAIAYAVYDYINYTDDKGYLAEYGLELLIAIARFWKQRVNWSSQKEEYVILGVTGPNEYENNVNNNWYTNYIAAWCLRYTLECMDYVKDNYADSFNALGQKIELKNEEPESWRHIIANMYYPYDQELGIYLQQDGFLDKEIIPVSELPLDQQPLNQHWSWDRILRSCYIKQADTLQGFYFFEDDFTVAEHKKHFEYYEPITVHESSLSPCVHSILACKLKMLDKAYEMYLRTARLDIDDYNNDTEDGLHITSMAGTWMTITKGFAGLRVKEGIMHFSPVCPSEWTAYEFSVNFRTEIIYVIVKHDEVTFSNPADLELLVMLNQNPVKIQAASSVTIELKTKSLPTNHS